MGAKCSNRGNDDKIGGTWSGMSLKSVKFFSLRSDIEIFV